MHIGIVHFAGPPVVGGVESTIFHHARVLSELGHKVTIIAGKGAAVLPEVTYQEEPLVGSRSEAILAAGRALAKGQIPSDFERLVHQTRTAVLNHLGECDAIIGHNLFTLHKNLVLTAAVHQLVQDGVGPPWIAWHHDFAWLRPQYLPQLYPGEPWELLRRPWPGVRHITVSQAQQVSLAELYAISLDDIGVITPGVAPLEFYRCNRTIARLIEKWNLLEADCVFLLPARITRRKNIELALHWLAAIREKSAWDAHLIVTGPPGPHNPTNATYLQQLTTLRSSLRLDSAAHFVYEAHENENEPLLLTDAEVANFYQIADAMFFTSEQEGFGVPILEAGLARLPIFATDLPPFRESAPGLAKLLPLDAPAKQVAQTIIKALKANQAFQLRRRVLTNFTWQGIVIQKVLPLLSEVSHN